MSSQKYNRNPRTSSDELNWLIKLRWLAVAGQSTVVSLTASMITDRVAMIGLVLTISAIALTNLFFVYAHKRSFNLSIGAILILDVVALSLLLYFSGGASNPFSLFYTLHVALAAILLGQSWTWIIAIISSLCYGLLFFYNIELPQLSHHHHNSHEPFSLHLQGMWVAFTLVATTLAFFFTRIIKALKEKEEMLKEAELRSLRTERIASITALAATAAHEINTPLATIKISAQEMVNSLTQNIGSKALLEDAQIILNQVSRCSETLERLRRSSGSLEGQRFEEVSIEELLNDIKATINSNKVHSITLTDQAKDLTIRAPRKSLSQALSALVKNGLESSETSSVTIDAERNEDTQTILVRDNGKGITQEIISKIGEPFFTTKPPGSGMGLGVFLARSLAEALGGTLNFSSKEGLGTEVKLEIPV